MLLLFGYLVISVGFVFGAPETSMISRYNVIIEDHVLISVEKTSNPPHCLDLARTSLVGIAKDAFPSDFSDLICLDLHDNQLTELPPSIFQFLMNLEYLSVSDNQLTNLDFVPYLPTSLRKLLLRDNQIDHIEPHIFGQLSELSELDLGDNKISRLEEGVFVGLAELTALDIGANEIKSINRDSFAGLSNKLSTLNIDRNHIQKLEAGTFSDGIPRSNLNLAGNEINEIESGTFHSELEDLDLGGNALTILNPESFNGLSNLKVIDLRGNNIKTIKISAYNLFMKYTGNAFVSLDPVIFTDDAGQPVSRSDEIDSALNNRAARITSRSSPLNNLQQKKKWQVVEINKISILRTIIGG